MMRRKDRETTEFSKMLDIVKKCDCCRIGMIDEGIPYIVPLNFGYEEKDGQLILYFHSAKEGRKISLIQQSPTVSFEMDTNHELIAGSQAYQFSYRYQCVMGTGKISILEDPLERIHGLQKLMAHYSEKGSWDFDKKCLEQVLVLKLEVSDWSCKKH